MGMLFRMYCARYTMMEIFFVLLVIFEGNPPVTGGFPSQRPVTQSFDISFDQRLNKRYDVMIIFGIPFT